MRSSLSRLAQNANWHPGVESQCFGRREVSVTSLRELGRRRRSKRGLHHIARNSLRCFDVRVGRVLCDVGLLIGRALSMRDDSAQLSKADPKTVPHITLSRWINEPYPPLTELLSAHDVARLTRRPRWLLVGLELIGRFPRKARFRGRALGWWRSDVLEWMARDLALQRHQTSSSQPCLRRQPRQPCLPLEPRGRCTGIRVDSPRRVRKSNLP
jgi:predicted DNA-binding transcriptional regulator AlpA